METKREHVLQNSVFALRTVFHYAPVIACVYAVFALTSSVFTVVQILFLEKLVNQVTAYIASPADSHAVFLWGVLYVASLIAAQLYQFSLGKLERHLHRKLTKSLSPAIIDKFSKIAYSYFENAECKDTMSRMTSDPQQMIHSTFLSVLSCVSQVMQLVGILGVFFRASFWIGMGAALIGIPMSILDLRATDKQQRLLREATMDQRMGEYQQGLFANKHSAYEIKIFRAKEHILDMWYETTRKIFSRYVRVTNVLLRTQGIVSLLKITYTAFAVVTLVLGFLSGKIELGVLVSILSSIGSLFSILGAASYSLSALGARTYEIGYYKEFLGFAEQERGTEHLASACDIVFENVTFRYPGTERDILHNLSFRIRSGEKVALVGVNGAGKSTIVKLLCGLYVPDSGRITIGGKDITALSAEALHKAIAVVFQDFGCYQLTLRENIALGDLTKLHADAALRNALSLAGGDSISGNGLDIPLGRLEEDSVDLSKGQWQRVAIARAFLSAADFIILDEPTASLDPIAESKLYASFASVLEKRGSILISHRLALARLAERIIVIEGGEVIESGSHTELMENGGLYSVMYAEQSGWYTGADK